METALVLPIPEAEDAVSGWRDRYDPSAAEGVPAHVTVIHPFKPDVTDADHAALADLFAQSDIAEIAFDRLGRFPGTLWLSPDPAAPIVELTQKVERRFPDYPPYGGAFDEIVPHLTVAMGDEPLLDGIAISLEAALADHPIVAHVSHCALYEKRDGRWREKNRYPLGGASRRPRAETMAREAE